jgi:hypothetical protein
MLDYELEKLTDEELDSKISKLQGIIFSNNVNLSLQARDIFAMYKYEQERRLDKKLSDHYKKKNKNKESGEDIPINIGS